MGADPTVGLDDVMMVVETIMKRTAERGLELPPFVVLVGGSALSVHGVRDLSTDIDYFADEVDDDIILQIETELKRRLGDEFKIDATMTPNLWGPIMIKDIAASPLFRTITVGGRKVEVKALTIEDLFLVKLAANRMKDKADLPGLASRADPDRLIERFNRLVGWFSNRNALPSFVDAFVREAIDLFGLDAARTIERLNVPAHVKAMLNEAHVTEPEP